MDELMENEQLQSVQFLLCQWQLFLYDLMCCYSNCCYSRKEKLVYSRGLLAIHFFRHCWCVIPAFTVEFYSSLKFCSAIGICSFYYCLQSLWFSKELFGLCFKCQCRPCLFHASNNHIMWNTLPAHTYWSCVLHLYLELLNFNINPNYIPSHILFR